MSCLGFTHALGLILASVDAQDLKIIGKKMPQLPSGAWIVNGPVQYDGMKPEDTYPVLSRA